MIIDGGQGEQVNGNTVVFHDEGGTPGAGFLRLDTFPQLTSIGQVTPPGATSPVPLFGQNGNLTNTYLTLGGFGLGIPTSGVPAFPGIQLAGGITDPMYDGVEITDVQNLELLLPNGQNTVSVESVPADLNLTVDPGNGHNTLDLEASGRSTTIDAGAGTNSIVIGQNGQLNQILNQLTVDGMAHIIEQTVPETGAQVGVSLLNDLPLTFVNTQTAPGLLSGSPGLTFAAAGQNGNPNATITRNGGSWVTDGFLPGDRIAVSGAGSDDGIYVSGSTAASVTPTVLTLAAGSNPVSGSAAGASVRGRGAPRADRPADHRQ